MIMTMTAIMIDDEYAYDYGGEVLLLICAVRSLSANGALLNQNGAELELLRARRATGCAESLNLGGH